MTVSGDLLTACEKAFLEVKGLRELKGVSDKQLKDYDARAASLEALVDGQIKLIDGQATESTELRKALAVERSALSEAKTSLALCRTEIDSLRRQRDSARRWAVRLGVIGVVVGAVVAVVIGGKL